MSNDTGRTTENTLRTPKMKFFTKPTRVLLSIYISIGYILCRIQKSFKSMYVYELIHVQ